MVDGAIEWAMAHNRARAAKSFRVREQSARPNHPRAGRWAGCGRGRNRRWCAIVRARRVRRCIMVRRRDCRWWPQWENQVRAAKDDAVAWKEALRQELNCAVRRKGQWGKGKK